ncbi:hypothetical protein ZIOFF_001298 [Zingiber officinale]|uniref:Uncharacterized protein n=1 Tax=Zingiber officinale TaxID=94328 RepID=A0A8J5HYF7_ZINOF|nr:hypothetical protein ZIOFF_001298 [Zingiber officinale]
MIRVQDQVCGAIEESDGRATFRENIWSRPGGSGLCIRRIMVPPRGKLESRMHQSRRGLYHSMQLESVSLLDVVEGCGDALRERNWVQKSYYLQSALAARLTLQAFLAGQPLLLPENFQETCNVVSPLGGPLS